MTQRDLPASFVSTAHATDGAKLSAPSALRNRDHVAAMLTTMAPASGQALEIASGTGEHMILFAQQMPGLIWQPTEPDPTRRASIDAHATESDLRNIRPAAHLDAIAPGWGAEMAGQDLIHLGNLLHLISDAEAATLLTEAAMALAPAGLLSLYGPFKRSGKLTSDGDLSFDARLRAEDPAIGYKDDRWVLAELNKAGLTDSEIRDMPANNLAIFARRPD